MQHQRHPIGFILSITRKVVAVTHHLAAFLGGWVTTACLLVIQHLLWANTSRQVRYLLGTGAVCMGCSVAGAILDDAVLAVMPWAIASAGLIILVIYWFEGQQHERERGAQKNGEIIGMAKGLSQDIIDRGGRHDAEPGLEQTRRRN